MALFDAEDERFGHQLPEPFRNVVHHNDSWRESLFFIMHKRNEPGDVIILTLAHFPAHNEMDSLQLMTRSQLVNLQNIQNIKGERLMLIA